MNDIELAKLFVEYSETKDKLDDLAQEIYDAVIEKGETVKLAGVTATYYKPALEVDYESAAKSILPDYFDILPYSRTITKVRWKDICEYLEADTGAFTTEMPARVVIK
jgi:hypothetical protein